MLCLKCCSAINNSTDKFIKCDGCDRAVHTTCSELSSTELKCLELRPSSKRRIKYICIECEQGVHQIPKLISMITDLKEEVRQLKENSTNLPSNGTSSGSLGSQSPLFYTEEIINEITDRNTRSYNVMIYGSVESCTSKQEQIYHDSGIVNSILTGLDLVEQNVKPIRLGKFDPTKINRSRPIRVRLSSNEAVRNIIRNFDKKLKTNVNMAGLSVSYDRTPKQIEIYKSVKKELLARLDKGENHLKIIYRNGIPTIVSSGN